MMLSPRSVRGVLAKSIASVLTVVVWAGGPLAMVPSARAEKVVDGTTFTVTRDSDFGPAGEGVTLQNGGRLEGQFDTSRTITLGNGGGAMATVGASTIFLGGKISGSGGLTFGEVNGPAGGGYGFSLYGAVDNDFTGLTTIEAQTSVYLKRANHISLSGDVLIKSGGTLYLQRSEQIKDTSTVTVEGTFLFGGGGDPRQTETIATLKGSGVIMATADSGKLVVRDGDFSGSLNDNTGVVSLEKDGPGTLILRGASSYSGGTTLAGGFVGVASTGSAFGQGAVTAALGAVSTLFATGGQGRTVPNAIVLNGTLRAGDDPNGPAQELRLSGPISGAGRLVLQNSAQVTLGGASSYFSGTQLEGTGIVAFTSDTAFGTGLIIGNSAGATLQANGNRRLANDFIVPIGGLTLQNEASGAAETLTLDGKLRGNGNVTKRGPGTLILNGQNQTNLFALESGALGIGNERALAFAELNVVIGTLFASGADRVLSNSILLSGTLTVGVDQGETVHTLTLNGVISGIGNLQKAGAGTVILGASNSYTGTTTLSGGLLGLGQDRSLGTGLVTTSRETTTGIFASGGNRTVDNAFNLLGTLAVTDAPSGTPNTLSLTGTIGGKGTLRKQDGGSLVLSGANTYSGGTELAGGFLTVNNDQALGAGRLTVTGVSTLGMLGTERTLQNDATLNSTLAVLNSASPAALLVLSGKISGMSGLALAGTGRIRLAGTNDYRGGTQLTAPANIEVDSEQAFGTGRIVIGTHDAVLINRATGIRNIANDIQLDTYMDRRTGDFRFSGNISGRGGVSLLGTELVALAGQNTFSGGVTVYAGGTIQVESDTALGTNRLAVFPDAKMYFLGDRVIGNTIDVTSGEFQVRPVAGVPGESRLTLAGHLLGRGALSLQDGQFRILAPNLVAGGLSLSGASLEIVDDKNLGLSGSSLKMTNSTLRTLAPIRSARPITLDTLGMVDTNGFDSVLTGQIGGNGKLVKSGLGSLTLTAQEGYLGGTEVREGALLVDGSLLRTTRVKSNGLLGGNGVVGGLLYNWGVVSPGHSPGTLTVQGNYQQFSSGTLRIEIGGVQEGAYDLLRVQGRAALAGTLQIVKFDGYRLLPGDQVTFLTAAGGVSGRFDSVTDQLGVGLVTPEVIYSLNSVAVTAVQASFQEALKGLTPNQRSVARALDATLEEAGQRALFRQLDGETLPAVIQDLDRIAPEELTSIFTTGISLAKVQAGNLQQRMDEIRRGSSGFSSSGFSVHGRGPGNETTPGLSPTGASLGKDESRQKISISQDEPRWGSFITGSGDWVDVDATGNARGYDLATGGVTMGVDYHVTPHLALGLSAGYAGTNVDLPGNGRLQVNGGKLGVYGTYFTGGFYADAAVVGGYNNYDSKRESVSGKTRGSTEGGEVNALIGLGYDRKVGGWTFGPAANFQYTDVEFQQFTEQGSLAPLRLDAQGGDSVRTSLGAKVAYEAQVGGWTLRPEVHAAWLHEYGDSSYKLDSSFAQAPGHIFTVNAPGLGRNSLQIQAGVSTWMNTRLSGYLFYNGELGRTNYSAHGVSAGVRVEF